MNSHIHGLIHAQPHAQALHVAAPMIFLPFSTLVGANESCHTYAWVISYIYMNHELIHTWTHTYTNTDIGAARSSTHDIPTLFLVGWHKWLMSHWCMSHVIYVWVTNPHIYQLIHTRTHTYTTACTGAAHSSTNDIHTLFHVGCREWVLSHLCMSYAIYVYGSRTHTYMNTHTYYIYKYDTLYKYNTYLSLAPSRAQPHAQALCVAAPMVFLPFSTLVGANESCHTYAWVMSYIYMSHELTHTCTHTYTTACTGAARHLRMSEWFVSCIYMSHELTHIYESRTHTYKDSYIHNRMHKCCSSFTHESCRKCTWVTSSHIHRLIHTRTHTYTTACTGAARRGTHDFPAIFHVGWRESWFAHRRLLFGLWHDWLIFVCEMTHSFGASIDLRTAASSFGMWHDAYVRDSFVKCLIFMWDMTHSYVRHDSFICETWLIHMWDMTHS